MKHPSPSDWHAQTADAVCNTLQTSRSGLSDDEAARRLREHGSNELQRASARSTASMVRAQLADPMILILIGAAVLSALLDEWAEGCVIFAIVVLNSVIGIVQEKKAESALEALRRMGAPQARVLRQGEESLIAASELVAGDIVLIEDGDMVPADMRLCESFHLQVQEASLTGESVPSEKDADVLLPADCPLGDRRNMLYASSIVTYGRGQGIVTGTGMNTAVGHIAGMLAHQDDFDTPLKRKLNAAGKTLTVIGLTPCYAADSMGAANASLFTDNFNSELAIQIAELKSRNTGLNLIDYDVYALFNNILSDPGSYGFTNIDDQLINAVDADNTLDPSTYLFYDDVHPTTAAHQIIAEAVYRALPEPSSTAVLFTALGFALIRRRRKPVSVH